MGGTNAPLASDQLIQSESSNITTQMPQSRKKSDQGESLWRHDSSLDRFGNGLVGVDEAGRGCLAGPVFAAAVFLPEELLARPWETWGAPRIDDSKKLSETEREAALVYIEQMAVSCSLRYATGLASVSEIDDHNILGATTLAMERALNGLELRLRTEDLPLWSASTRANPAPLVLIDGRPVRKLPFAHQALVGGDGKSLSIALASILAKVERDAWMKDAHLQHPQYGWDRNRGYGTAVHRRGIEQFGPCPLHRKLFLRKIVPTGSE